MIVIDEVSAETLAADNTPAALAEQLAALKAQTAKVEAQLRDRVEAERTKMIRGICETMMAHGITLADLAPTKPKPVPVPRASAGAKLTPKYTDGQGNFWAGRGLTPHWLKAALEEGAELESFRVAPTPV